MNNIIISPQFVDDLDGIVKYITEELENKAAANNLVIQVFKKIDQLVDFSAIGETLSSKTTIPTPYRYLVCGNYIILYRVDANDVYVDKILYGRRNYLKTLFGDLEIDD